MSKQKREGEFIICPSCKGNGTIKNPHYKKFTRFHGNELIICDHKATSICPLKAKGTKKTKDCSHSKPHRSKEICQEETFLCLLPDTVSPIDGDLDVLSVSCVPLKDEHKLEDCLKKMSEETIRKAEKEETKFLEKLAKKHNFVLVDI